MVWRKKIIINQAKTTKNAKMSAHYGDKSRLRYFRPTLTKWLTVFLIKVHQWRTQTCHNSQTCNFINKQVSPQIISTCISVWSIIKIRPISSSHMPWTINTSMSSPRMHLNFKIGTVNISVFQCDKFLKLGNIYIAQIWTLYFFCTLFMWAPNKYCILPTESWPVLKEEKK